VEGADALLKATHYRRICLTGSATVEPPDRPFPSRWIEGPKSNRSVGTGRCVQGVVIHDGLPAHVQTGRKGSLKVFPLLAVSEAVLEAPVLDVPVSHQKIEIMHTRDVR